MPLFDAHCHLQDPKLMEQLPGVAERARSAGVGGFACCATEEADWPAVARLAAEQPEIVPAFGIHPWYMGACAPGWQDRLRERLAAVPSAGVGEIGLDHAIRERNDELQMRVFFEQLNVAVELERPVSLHCRQAWGAMLDTLTRIGRSLPGFVVHSYSGAVDHVEPLAGLGARFSFSGTITRSRNHRGHAAARAVPLDRLLIETDSPDLMPVRGDRVPPADGRDPDPEPNEPANLVYVCRRVAELRGMPVDELADITWRNARRLFLKEA